MQAAGVLRRAFACASAHRIVSWIACQRAAGVQARSRRSCSRRERSSSAGGVANPEVDVIGEHRLVPEQEVHAPDQQIFDTPVAERAEDVIDIHAGILPATMRGVHPARAGERALRLRQADWPKPGEFQAKKAFHKNRHQCRYSFRMTPDGTHRLRLADVVRRARPVAFALRCSGCRSGPT